MRGQMHRSAITCLSDGLRLALKRLRHYLPRALRDDRSDDKQKPVREASLLAQNDPLLNPNPTLPAVCPSFLAKSEQLAHENGP